MNIDRFQQLLDAYGASVDRWPVEERQAATLLLDASEEAKARQDRAARLDEVLDAHRVEVPEPLRDKIIAATRDHGLPERFLDWLVPDRDRVVSQLWRPALAASLPLALGIALGSIAWPDNTTNDEVWKEEIYLMALTSDPSEAPR